MKSLNSNRFVNFHEIGNSIFEIDFRLIRVVQTRRRSGRPSIAVTCHVALAPIGKRRLGVTLPFIAHKSSRGDKSSARDASLITVAESVTH